MAAVCKSLFRALVFLIAVCGALASPIATKIDTIKSLIGRDTFEWTALGDSYSSGVGAGDYIADSYRCLRYDHAYPVIMNSNAKLPPGGHIFHNAVCSGSHTSDVVAYQLLDEDSWGIPNGQYGFRPKFGNPAMGSLSIGGNDIEFPGILFNCILEWNLPYDIGAKKRPCSEQKAVTWSLIKSPELVNNIDATIHQILVKAHSRPIGKKFKLYVTGFPRFFNEDTEECNNVTFARSANPHDDGKEHIKMTRESRKEFNEMSIGLNKAIEAAVSRHVDEGVRWIPINDHLDGHRFCEPHIKEPDQQNPNLWIFTTHSNDKGIQDPLRSSIGNRAKVFHPHPFLHETIRDLVLQRYISDLQADQARAHPHGDVNAWHGISGNHWVFSRDVALDNVKDFCRQRDKTVAYNYGTVNELSLSASKLGDDTKTPADAPDCVGRFQRAVLDGCDGGDVLNNPYNYKYGSTLTTADDWVYAMAPLREQVNEVSCDVSYKFMYDAFEIQGKNLPFAKFGANGEGLREQLRGCGWVTEWYFAWTPEDVKFQWYASGHLPVGTRNCVGNALMTAGGARNGNCHGAGK